MAGEPITSEMLQEAGIAAHLAADPDALPQEISELSDQAAIFASQSINAFMLRGAADADSAATNFGTSLATKAVERMIELEAERRKEDDPASDASMIAEAGARQREELAEMQRVSVGGVELSLEEWDEIAEALNDPAVVNALREDLRAQGKSQAEISDILYLTRVGADIARKEARGLPLTAEEQAVQHRLETDPVAQQRFQEGTERALSLSKQISQADLGSDEIQNANISAIEDDAEFRQVALETVDETEVARAELARDGMSNAGNPFADTRSPNAEFNAQAAGDVQVAQTAPPQTAPAASGPTLLNG